MKTKLSLVSLFLLALFLGAGYVALALDNDPLIFFTDNASANGTTLLVTDMEHQLLQRLNGATSTIDAAIYTLNRTSIREALIAAHNRGVTVRVVTDDDAYNEISYQPHFQALEMAGIPLLKDNRSSLMHNKFIVIDSLITWTGSTNLTHTGFTLNHNNSIVFTSTQIADIYRTEFDEMFVSGLFGTAKTDNTPHNVGSSLEVYFSPSDGAMAEIINEVNLADESIYFSIFSMTEDNLSDAIITKIQLGVTVEGIVDLLGASNQASDDEMLCQAGAAIKTEDFPGKMHNKLLIIDANGDDPTVVTGSMNWSEAGDASNDENIVIIHDPDAAQVYVAAFQALYNALGDDTLCQIGFPLFLPLVLKSGSVSAPTATPTPTNTLTPTPTPTPTATSVPPTEVPTWTPSPTATRMPSTSDVRVTYIEYNPPGSDAEGEYVDIQNFSSTTVDMTDWTLRDEVDTVFTFPVFSLGPQNSVRVWVRSGTDDASNLYWGRNSATWNNNGDTAFLKDASGNEVDTCSYPGGGEGVACE